MHVSIVTGWTEPLDWELRNEGVAVDLTGCTPELVVRDGAAELELDGVASLPNAAGGRVRFAPAEGDFEAVGRFAYRWRITDATGKVSYFPNEAPGVLEVGP